MKKKAKIQEVVINADHGGFSLSRKAFLRLRELGNKQALAEPDIGEYWDDGSGPRTAFGHGDIGSFCRDIARDSKDLIKVVKELGKKADGSMASLRIVRIPQDVNWVIEEYDGSEWVAEVHRTWR